MGRVTLLWCGLEPCKHSPCLVPIACTSACPCDKHAAIYSAALRIAALHTPALLIAALPCPLPLHRMALLALPPRP